MFWGDIVKPDSPCCAHCYIGVQDLNLYFWEDQAIPTASPGVSSYVDEEGFTL